MTAQKILLTFLLLVISLSASAQSANPSVQPAKPAANPALNEDLINAAKRGELAKVKELLARGAEVNAKTRYNQTPLMLAAQQGHTEVVKVLLEAKADPDVMDSFYKNVTALSASTERGHTEIVKLLLDKGAKGKENALVIASMEGHKPIVEHLLKLGLNQQILSTALARATDAEQKEIAELLKTAGAKLAEKTLKPEVKVDEAALRKYVGTYRIDEARQYTFVVKDGKLNGWDVRQFSLAITAVDTNVFRFGNDDTRTLSFNEENGKVVSVTLNQNGFKQTYNRVEGK